MRPTNLSNSSCNPISSNCVIWDGPDLDCIDLQSGDSVSEVVYNIAKELCEVIDALEITSYDLSCFNFGNCQPSDYKELIQFILNKLCEKNNITLDSTNNDSEVLETMIPVAPAFYVKNQATGNIEKQMTLKNYVIAIGERLSNEIKQISNNTNNIKKLNEKIDELIENSGDEYDLPFVPSTYIKPGENLTISDFIQYLEKDLYPFKKSVGEENSILSISRISVNQFQSLSQLQEETLKMNQLNGWIADPLTFIDSYNDIVLVVKDIRETVSYMYNVLKSGNFLKPSINIEEVSYESRENVGKWINILFSISDAGMNIEKAQVVLNNCEGSDIDYKDITSDVLRRTGNSVKVEIAADELNKVNFDTNIVLYINVNFDKEEITTDRKTIDVNAGINITIEEDQTNAVLKTTNSNYASYKFELYEVSDTTSKCFVNYFIFHKENDGTITAKLTGLKSNTSYLIIQEYNNIELSKQISFITKSFDESLLNVIDLKCVDVEGEMQVNVSDLNIDYVSDYEDDIYFK